MSTSSPTFGEVAQLQSDQSDAVDADTGAPPGRRSRWFAASLLWLLCLFLSAAGHWIYVSLRTLDRSVSSDRYRAPGKEIAWVGYGSLEQAVERAQSETVSTTAISNSEIGRMTALPFSPFWMAIGASFAVAAVVAVWGGQWMPNNGLQSLVGLLAGHAVWIGVVEIGLDLAGRRLGLSGALTHVDGRLVGVHGSGILIQMSVIFLLPVLVGLALHESNRCAVFQWFRRRLPLTKSAGASGRVDNYAARTMVQFFMTVWVCYVAVLWMADPVFGQWGHAALLVMLASIAAATPYMIWRTVNQADQARMFRYSVSGAVITWTGIEIASATGMIHEPWLEPSPVVGAVLIGSCLALTAIAVVLLSNLNTKPEPA